MSRAAVLEGGGTWEPRGISRLVVNRTEGATFLGGVIITPCSLPEVPPPLSAFFSWYN